MPRATRHDSLLLRLLKDVNDIRSALRRVTVNLPLFDIANENTPAQLTSDQNNYVPGNYDILKLSSDQAGRTITGFRGGIKGRFLKLFNVGSYEIVLSHQSVSSDAENRIISPTQTDILINAGGEINLYYDSSQLRWIASFGPGGDRISVDLELSGAQSIGDSSFEYISWTSEVKDTGNFFAAGTPTYITIPESGWYSMRTHLAWAASVNGYRGVVVRDIDSFTYYIADSRSAISGGGVDVDLSRTMYFPIGTKIGVYVWQNSGGPLNMNVTGSLGVKTSFNVARM